jgi:hypothetical protein
MRHCSDRYGDTFRLRIGEGLRGCAARSCRVPAGGDRRDLDRGHHPLRGGGARPERAAPALPALRGADLYPEPEAFRPERFLDGGPQPYAWIPFGGGVRRCLGASMAMTEMRVVLTTLLRQAAIAPARAGKPARERRQTLSFGPDGVRVLLREAA